MRWVLRFLTVYFSLTAALREDSSRETAEEKHYLHPEGAFRFHKDSYNYICGAGHQIVEKQAKIIKAVCEVNPNSTKLHRQLSSLVHKHPALCGGQVDDENPEFSSSQFMSIVEIGQYSADRIAEEMRLMEVRLTDLINRDRSERHQETVMVLGVTMGLALLTIILNGSTLLCTVRGQKRRHRRTTDTLVDHKERITDCETVGLSTQALASQTKKQMRRLVKRHLTITAK